jgi:RimJ/RimL family protein N-acetyltransferase
MPVLKTQRLSLRQLRPDDAAFIHALVNDPDWLRFIGDRGVRTVTDAATYLERGPIAMYARLGFGLWMVERKGGGALGICGLIKRATLEDVDLGFAFMPAFRGQGYAFEAALATRDYGVEVLGLDRIVAITAPENAPSARLLERLGFTFERIVGPDADPVRLFAFNA